MGGQRGDGVTRDAALACRVIFQHTQSPKPQAPFPSPTNQALVTPTLWKWRQENQKFKVIFGLHSKLEASLGYIRPYLKKKKKKSHGD